MEDKTTRKITIDSIKLTSDLLRKLCEVINEQSLEFKKTEDEENKKAQEDKNYFTKNVFYHASFSFSIKNNEKEYENSDQFLNDCDTTKFKDIKLNFYSDERKISVWFDREYFRDITVEGNPKWVPGITQRIEDIVEGYETKNKFFYSRPAWLIYFGIPIVIIIGIIFGITPFFPTSEITTNDVPLLSSITKNLVLLFFFIFTIPAATILETLFHRLYPRVEIENSWPTKIRKWIIGAIVTLTLSVIGSGIFYFFQLLSNQP